MLRITPHNANSRIELRLAGELQRLAQNGTPLVLDLDGIRFIGEDIPLLAAYFADQMATHLDKPIRGLEAAAEGALLAYGWPGNVRELEHTVRRAVVVAESEFIQNRDLALESTSSVPEKDDELLTPEEYERFYIEKMLEKADWTIKGPTGAAALMGVPVSTLRNRMIKLGIKRQ